MVAGRYFPPNQARFVAAEASVVPRRVLRIADEDGRVLGEGPARGLKTSARLAALTRRFDLPGGARFETEDNDGADALLLRLWRVPHGALTARLERAWPAAAAAAAMTLAAAYLFIAHVAPSVTEHLAKLTLATMAHPMSEQALLALDRYALEPTTLGAADQARANALFAKVAARGRQGASAYRLVLRSGWRLGPNAFALPDGTVVLTDRLWFLAKDDDEIEGVFAHEIAHVDHAHQLQRVYQVALEPAALATVTGDISDMSAMAANLPGLIAQASYSRAFERQADDDAAAMLRELGARPSHLAALLARLDRLNCAGRFCPTNWVADHPGTAARVARLRAEDAGAIADDCIGDWRSRIALRCWR